MCELLGKRWYIYARVQTASFENVRCPTTLLRIRDFNKSHSFSQIGLRYIAHEGTFFYIDGGRYGKERERERERERENPRHRLPNGIYRLLPLDHLISENTWIVKPRSHRPTQFNWTKQLCWVESRRAMWSRLYDSRRRRRRRRCDSLIE